MDREPSAHPGALADRIALVTGAGQGVGAGIAHRLAAAGALVVVNDLYTERAVATAAAIAESGGRAHPIAYDVTDLAAVRTAIDGVAGTVGPVDIFVSNAGVPSGASMQRPFLEHTPDTWRTEVDLSLYGAVHGLHAVLPGMIERGWGRVIVISSGAAAQGLRIGVSMYGAAKAAVEGLVRHVAVEVARNGVTVNALALGLMDNVAGVASSDELLRSLARNIPVGRLGSGDEVGGACTWLAGDDGAWVTGQVIHINGGGLFGR